MALYRFADICVEMDPQHALTKSRAEKYRVNCGKADMVLTGGGDASEEYANLARSFYGQLTAFDGLLLHASAVMLDGKAYAFSAPSGTGKSTHTAFWEQEFGGIVINDDKPAVRLIDGVFCACGTPFCGKHDKSRNLCVPLGGVVFLRRAQQNVIKPMSSREALMMLLTQTPHPGTMDDPERAIALLDRLLNTVPFYQAGCMNVPSAAYVTRDMIVK